MIDKALALAADAVILDLEDGVPVSEKDRARDLIAEALGRPATAGAPARAVRVNVGASGRLEGDLRAVVRPGLDAVVLPKVEAPAEVSALDHALAGLEAETGLTPGRIAVVVAIESARGLVRAVEILAASRRVIAVFFGAEDFALDLGLPVRRSGAGRELLAARSAVVVAAASARVQPIDQVWLDFRDTDGLRDDAVRARDLGFTGKCLIHPSQIDVVNEVFRPSDEDVALARDVVMAYEQAIAKGVGAVMLGGQLVELPIVERAKATLRLAEAVVPVERQ